MKSVNCSKPGYTSITCSNISNIPYNLIFTTKFNNSSILITIISQDYRITGNFCGVKFLLFWSKKKTFNFCGFFFLRIENLGTKKNCLYYRKQQRKGCYDKQLVHITVILPIVFSPFSRSILLTGNTKSTAGSISVKCLIFRIYIFCRIFILYHITFFFKRIMIRSNYIQFFQQTYKLGLMEFYYQYISICLVLR